MVEKIRYLKIKLKRETKMAGLRWNHETGMAEWDQEKETPTEMCDRLLAENGIRPKRGQSIASNVRGLVFVNIQRDRDIPLSIAKRDLLQIVSSGIECDGFNPKLSRDEADFATYIFERMIEDGWHTLGPNGKPSVYVEPKWPECQYREQQPQKKKSKGSSFFKFIIFGAIILVGLFAVAKYFLR